MKYEVGDIVKVVGDTFYHNAIGFIAEVEPESKYPYYVVFKAVDDETKEEFIYEDYTYTEDEIELI